MPTQLALGISLPENSIFSNYLSQGNEVAVGLCQSISARQDDKQVLLWGAAAVGKTHLLQAACSRASEQGLSASYLPLKELESYGPDLLQGLHSLDLVCIDDVQLCAGDDAWELALFSFINLCRSSGTRLLLSANNSVTELGVELPDLRSRLGWGAVVQIQELSDADKLLWLQQRAQRQGLVMPEDVARYLLRHYPRDMHSQHKIIDILNTASLAAQRRLSVRFVKEALASLPAP